MTMTKDIVRLQLQLDSNIKRRLLLMSTKGQGKSQAKTIHGAVG
jgi:hypothetical protein